MSEVAEVDFGKLLGYHGKIAFFDAPATSIREEGRPLFLRHWLEAAPVKSRPLSIHWPTYEERERQGIEVCIIARDTQPPGWSTEESPAPLAGYALYMLYRHVLYGTVVADGEAFYLARQYRKGWLGMRLIREAEKVLYERGADEVWHRLEAHVRPGRGRSDLQPLFRYLGYKAVEVAMRRRLP